MKKIYFVLLGLFLSFNLAIAKQGGVLTCNPDPIDPSLPVTVSYDGTGTNFANWEPKCHIHAWVVSKSDPSKSIANMDWANCKGDADYAALDSKVKMTKTAIGKYEITLTIKDFFGLTDDQVADAGKLGIIVRAQYGGDDNQTSDMFLAIGEPIIPVDRFGINWGVDQQEGWQSAEFVQSQENENIYTVEVEVPEDFADISFWVGKNKNGVGNPEWNEGISATALLSAIEGVKAGMNVFAIDKTSTEKNWDIKLQQVNEPEPMELTYTVKVPAGTKACYFIGDATDSWAEFWEMYPNQDGSTYSVTIQGAKKSDKYKYSSGPDFAYIEKTANGDEVADRVYSANDNVAAWAAIYDPAAVGMKNEVGDALCKVEGNIVTVKADIPSSVSIYSVEGKLITQENVSDSFSTSLRKGLYIIRVNNSSYKVILR